MSAEAIRLQPQDNVATVLRAIAAGERLSIGGGGETLTVTAVEPILMCHKISVQPIEAGAAEIKYGHSIREAQTAVAAGRHVYVHVHDLRSARAKVSE